MINNPEASAHAEIADLVASLSTLVTAYMSQSERDRLSEPVVLPTKSGKATVDVPRIRVRARARRCGQHVYGVSYDLIHDIEKEGKTVLQVFRDLEATGEILECALDFDAVGSLDGVIDNQLPLRLVFATVAEPDIVGGLLGVSEDKYELLFESSLGGE